MPKQVDHFFKGRAVGQSVDVETLVTEDPAINGAVQEKIDGLIGYTFLAGAIVDIHDQTMGSDATVSFDVGSAEPQMFGADSEMVVLDPV